MNIITQLLEWLKTNNQNWQYQGVFKSVKVMKDKNKTGELSQTRGE